MIKLGRYKHFKGNVYEVIAIAKHSETLEDMVVYQSVSDMGKIWVRPLKMWEEKVEVNGKSVKRFEYID